MARKEQRVFCGVRRAIWMAVALFVITLGSSFLVTKRRECSAVEKRGTNLKLSPAPTMALPQSQSPRRSDSQVVARDQTGSGFLPPETAFDLLDIGVFSPFGLAETAFNPDDESSIPELIECLRHPSPPVRAAAALALGAQRFGALEAIPVLKELAHDDSDDVVRRRASDALYNIRLYDWGPGEF